MLMKKKGKLGTRGQAAIEYVMLIAAMAAIIFSMLNYLKTEILGRQGVDCTPGDRSLKCSLQKIVDGLGTNDPNFRFFVLKR